MRAAELAAAAAVVEAERLRVLSALRGDGEPAAAEAVVVVDTRDTAEIEAAVARRVSEAIG